MPIVWSLLALGAGLVLLEAGADRFTDAIGTLSRRLNTSENVTGLLTAGAEWEELLVVIVAIAGGYPGLAVGNVIGSCLANLTGSMPLGLFGPRPLAPDRSARVYAWVMLLVTALAAVFLLDGRVEPAAGGLLVGVFVVYVASVLLIISRGWLRPIRPIEDDDDDDEMAATASLPRLLGVLVLGLVVITIGAELVVEGAVRIAGTLGLSDYAIGATVVAVGTTLPDKAISFIGGRRGQSGIVTANATGSNIFVLTLVLGLAALFSGSGLAVDRAVVQVDLPLLLLASGVIVVLFNRASIHWRSGVVLVTFYVGYVVYALVRGG